MNARLTVPFGFELTDTHLYRPGPPIPAVLQHGISDNQSKMYAEQLTSGVNQLLGKDPSLKREFDQNLPWDSGLMGCWYAGFARRLVIGKDVVLSVEVSPVKSGPCCFYSACTGATTELTYCRLLQSCM